MENKKIIIALVGLYKSGKTAVSKYLHKKYGAVNLRFSKFLADILKKCYYLDSKDRSNLQRISTALRKEFGQNFLGKIISSFVDKSNKNIFVLDGVRRWDDIGYLTSRSGIIFILVAIDADSKVRWQRSRKQNEETGDAQIGYEEFLVAENNEADAKIKQIMKQADIKIDTTKLKKEEHLQRWDEIIQRLLKN